MLAPAPARLTPPGASPTRFDMDDDVVHALLSVLRGRRSRRFGLGMTMPAGPLAFASRHAGRRLTEEDEARLVFAACGITGPALADLSYAKDGGGTIMSGLVGRTVPSGDGIQTVALVLLNPDGAFYLRRPQDFAPEEIPRLIELATREEYVELYRRSRVRIADRVETDLEPLGNLACNRWSLFDPAATYVLPVGELTQMYLNGLLELFGEGTAAYVVDERAGFRPAGLRRFARSRGGHLHDDPRDERVLTIQQVESLVTEFVTVEQGMMLQNVALMAQALGLGGFPHWAAHPFAWFEALGFRMERARASRYLGMGPVVARVARLLGRDAPVPYAVGLERDGVPLLAPYCPPWHPTMADAVRAVADLKFGRRGIFRGLVTQGAWREPERIAAAAPETSPAAIAATIAYGEYVHRRYGRFPAYAPPLRTVLGFQVNHVDVEFYEKHYRPEALSETQRARADRVP